MPLMSGARPNRKCWPPGEHFETYKKLEAAGYIIADLIVASTEFGKAYPDAVTGFLHAYANALAMYKSKPAETAAIVAKQAGVTPEVAAGDMAEYDFVSFDRQLSPQWLGMPGKPGKFASVLKSTADFLVAQKSIRSAPGLDVFEQAINTTFMRQAANAT